MGLVASSKDLHTEASTRKGERVSHVLRGKNDLISLGQDDHGGTYGNVGIWTLFGGQQGIIASHCYDIRPGLTKQANLMYEQQGNLTVCTLRSTLIHIT